MHDNGKEFKTAQAIAVWRSRTKKTAIGSFLPNAVLKFHTLFGYNGFGGDEMADKSGYEPMSNSERAAVIGLLLKTLREEKGLSMGELSLRMEINKQTYAGYEKGRYEPKVETLIRLAYFYDVSMDFITGKTMFGRDGLLGEYDAKAWLEQMRADDFTKNQQNMDNMFNSATTLAIFAKRSQEMLETAPDLKAFIEEKMETLKEALGVE